MKTMNYRNIMCQMSFEDDFHFDSVKECGYCEDAVKYAVMRMFTRSAGIRRYCTRASWKMRLAKGRGKKPHLFVWRIPSRYLELPGDTAVVRGCINTRGVFVSGVRLEF